MFKQMGDALLPCGFIAASYTHPNLKLGHFLARFLTHQHLQTV
jgi:hypothetical protein